MEKQDKGAEERAEKTAVSGENGALAGEPENNAPRGESAADGREASVKPARPVEESEADLRYQDGKAAFKGGVLGFFIGLAVIVPGVSGSTVAILFRLYEKLLYALGNIFKKFKKCARFLLPIAVGLVVGLLIGFFAVQNLVELVPFAVVGKKSRPGARRSLRWDWRCPSYSAPYPPCAFRKGAGRSNCRRTIIYCLSYWVRQSPSRNWFRGCPRPRS